ncbi:hypothetical protein C8J57DRAFT_1250422 [Mycena rebaudengoi]|nr:hypothetical protein C8J57DRAFT_1250422 [Mycena rebaudengoi]
MAKHPFWGASNVGWWMVVITRPVAGTQAANEAPNAAKTTFWGRKRPQTLLRDVTSGGAPSSSGSSRPKFSVPPSAAGSSHRREHGSSHTFSGIPGSTPHPGISLPGGGPLGPSFNPGPLALWVGETEIASRCAMHGLWLCFFDGAPIGYLSDANICPLGGSSIFDAETLASLVRMFQVLSLKNFPTPWKPEPEALFGIFTV